MTSNNSSFKLAVPISDVDASRADSRQRGVNHLKNPICYIPVAIDPGREKARAC
jgi:hypothetical protein